MVNNLNGFLKRLKSMCRVDFKRMFTMPLVYILAGVSFLMPILILVMTSMLGGSADGADISAYAANGIAGDLSGGLTGGLPDGAGGAMSAFTNVWQIIGSVSGASAGMDLTGMCNVNLLYFLTAVLVCVFVSDDFRSGFAKNLFTVRAKKADYVASKTIVTFTGAAIMFLTFFVGAMLGGAIAGLSFDTSGFGAGGIIACFLTKIFIIAIFVSVSLAVSVAAKQKLWLSVLGSFAAGMLLFTMIPMIAPLNCGFINVIMGLAGGALFCAGLGAVSNVVLSKTSLV